MFDLETIEPKEINSIAICAGSLSDLADHMRASYMTEEIQNIQKMAERALLIHSQYEEEASKDNHLKDDDYIFDLGWDFSTLVADLLDQIEFANHNGINFYIH